MEIFSRIFEIVRETWDDKLTHGKVSHAHVEHVCRLSSLACFHLEIPPYALDLHRLVLVSCRMFHNADFVMKHTRSSERNFNWILVMKEKKEKIE